MKSFLLALMLIPTISFAEEMCEVKICNKIERFSLNPWSHLKDKFGESCFTTSIPKSQAIVGSTLSEESRWYQGSSINPTKRSVTKIKEVYCR